MCHQISVEKLEKGRRVSLKTYFIVGLVIAIIFLIIAICYLVNSIHQYGTWKAPTILCVLFAMLGIFCGIGLLKTSHKPKETSSIQTATNGRINMPNMAEQMSIDQQQSKNEQTVLKELQNDYQKLGNVSFDETSKTYKIRVADQNTIKGLDYVLQHPNQAKQVGYNKLTDNLKQTSLSITKVLGNQYQVALMNPQNNQQAMYVVQNGNVQTDVIVQK